jgi:hypothetical protein
MQEHPNADLWRKGQEAFSRRDFDALRNFWAEDIVYHFPGASHVAGDHRGLQAVLAFFAKLVEMNVQIAEVHDVLASDEHVVALVRATASRPGKELSFHQANVYNVRDGKVTEAWLLPTDQAALDEFLS